MTWRRWVANALMTVAGWLDEGAERIEPLGCEAGAALDADARVRLAEGILHHAMDDRDAERAKEQEGHS